MTGKKAFTLLELFVVMAIFGVVFGAALAVFTASGQSWRIGQRNLREQQQARQAMDNMTRLLRQSSPNWVISGTDYPVSITLNNRIDFYQPLFDADGQITALKKITFKLNPDNPRQLLKKEGTAPEAALANNVSSLSFSAGCSGCLVFNCSTVASDCPVVNISIQTVEDGGFTLSSAVTLRNTNMVLADTAEVQQPEEGEF